MLKRFVSYYAPHKKLLTLDMLAALLISIIGMVYVMDQKQDFGNPTRGYYDTVRRGYKDCHLDMNVLENARDSSAELAQHRMIQEPVRPW